MTPERWRRVEELFHAAREQPLEQRPAWLAAECGDDSGLRREVESLLAQQDGTLLEQGAAVAGAALVENHARGNYEGRSLGSYALGPLLGSGGMGDVYRARDTKLGRDVAVKILPDAFSSHPQRLARFEREARVLASLSHPHIAAIYGVETSNGVHGLILELVEGVTLAEKLRSGGTAGDAGTALPLVEALDIARQIADALDAAHQQGIVHRDLKPSNIKITPRGEVKVLDFGLAKSDHLDTAGPGSLPAVATSEGVVLGTVAYMSPEQARGLTVDKRADIWAFGCVLYEMLTGARTFPGDTSADVLGAIVSSEPDWSRLPASTPRRVRDVLRRCLTKNLDRRLRDIADARLELEDAIGEIHVGEGIDAVSRPPHVRRALLPWIIAALIAAAAAVAVWYVSRTPAANRTPARVAIPLPDDVSLFAIGRGSSVAVSPDGQQLVYAAIAAGRRQLYRRPLNGNDTPIPGTEGAANPFFSADGKWIGFTANPDGGDLKKVPVAGGAPFTIVGDMLVQSATWASDDTIVFGAVNPHAAGLWRVSASGGTPQRLTTPGKGESAHTWPQVIAERNSVLFTIFSNTGFRGTRIALASLAGGQPRVIVEGASYGRLVAAEDGTSYLIYAQPEGLLAVRFDLEKLAPAGPAVRVLDRVLMNLSGGAHFTVSSAGLLAYIPGPGTLAEQQKTLLWVDAHGASEIATITGFSFDYDLSPDGRRVVRPHGQGPERDLWVDDLERPGTPVRLTFGGINSSPVWTADGKRVIYASAHALFWIPADGTGEAEQLSASANRQIPTSVSPDGSLLAYVEIDPKRRGDIWLLPLQGSRQPRRFLSTPAAEYNATFSPDGKWLAYSSDISGRYEIHLVSLANAARQLPVSSGGGYEPIWAPDGRELYYRTAEPAQGGDMMAVSIDTTGPDVRIGTPRLLFPSPYQGNGDIAPDGRFLLLKRTPEEASARAIQLVFNWTSELRQKVQ